MCEDTIRRGAWCVAQRTKTQMNVKTLLILTGAAAAGNFVAERFLLKDGPDDPSGFVEVKPGFGMDDVARAATIAVIAMLAYKFTKA